MDLIDREQTLNVLDAEAWRFTEYLQKDIGNVFDVHLACFVDDVRERIKDMPTVQAIPIEDILGHAKAIKEYCQQRDNIDDCCEGCPFHDYLGTKGICVLNYGLYPNEWYKPNNEGSDTE